MKIINIGELCYVFHLVYLFIIKAHFILVFTILHLLAYILIYRDDTP